MSKALRVHFDNPDQEKKYIQLLTNRQFKLSIDKTVAANDETEKRQATKRRLQRKLVEKRIAEAIDTLEQLEIEDGKRS